MKKFLNLMLKHVEKIIFAFTMIILIVLISVQLNSLKAVQADITDAKKAAAQLQEDGRYKSVPTINLDEFDMKTNIQEPWMPAYTLGDWKTYSEGQDPRIFGPLRNPPSTLPDAYVDYISEFGAGSLFDPALYVIPLDGKNHLISFEASNAYYSPYNSDIFTTVSDPVTGDDDDDDDDDDDVTPTTKDFIPANLVLHNRTIQARLKFQLATAMARKDQPKEKWTFQFKIRGQKDEFVQIGKEIKGTGYKVVDGKTVIEDLGAFKKTTFAAIVDSVDNPGQQIELKPGDKPPVDPNGKTTYGLYYVPKGKTTGVEDGETVKLKSRSKTYEYEVLGEGANFTLIDTSSKKEYKVKRYSKSEARRLRKSLGSN